ncbi:MAG: DUF4363 family protein [Clostridia bacterium]|nr:DUF4363 family protein [Clostridia bacterium]
MKRVYIAIGLLVTVCALCVFAVVYLSYQTESMIREMDHLTDIFNPERPEEYLDETKAVIESFRKRAAFLPFFIRQNTLMEIEAELETLPALIEKGEPLDFVGTLSRCQTRLETQLRIELPLPRNIF